MKIKTIRFFIFIINLILLWFFIWKGSLLFLINLIWVIPMGILIFKNLTFKK